MWSVGLWLLMLGYAMFYTGLMNFKNGGNGPRLAQALGIEPPGNIVRNPNADPVIEKKPRDVPKTGAV